ncbi:unnamed protein product [Phytophthora fragariaefolia]|uniref:Unnamed protein product n=1 Tax=Phytophthora fragariaefolia TaxID=1490495 RepID=A0A9W6X8V5_9STRA|nr:unnamed protein product [Phytophthora fragariaefolia]
MAFLAEDDDAFAALLSFVDDFGSDVTALEDAAVGVAAAEEQLRADELDLLSIEEMPLQGEEDDAAVAESKPPPRRSARLSSRLKNNGDGLVGATPPVPDALRSSRRAVNNAKKNMLRKAGVYADPNRARNERKLEIAYLHEKVGQLETKLQSLQERPSPAVASNALPTHELHDSSEHSSDQQAPGLPSSWEELAARELGQREESERENVRLKLVLTSQIKVAKSLERILLKRIQQQVRKTWLFSKVMRLFVFEKGNQCSHGFHVQVSECSAAVQGSIDVACPSGRTLDFRADATDFQELLQYLDAAYSEVDAVLAGNGLNTMEMTQQDLQMREGVNGMYLEVFSNKVMPFGLHATAEATWNYFKGSKKHRGTLYSKAAQELVANNSSTDVRIKQIIRRYVEPHREVVVWVASIEPVDTHKPFGGFKSRHRNYAVIKRARASTPQHELSLLQLVAHSMLDTESGTIYDPKYVRALTDFLLNDAARNVKADQQLIENILLDQMLRP